MRVGRFPVPDLNPADATLTRGKFGVLRPGDDVTIIATGTLVSRALHAADLLAADGVDTRVLNAAYIAPLDTEAINAACMQTKAIITAEEANVSGGLGAAVASHVAQSSHRTPMRILGIRDEFAPTGSTAYLLEHFGLTSTALQRVATETLGHA